MLGRHDLVNENSAVIDISGNKGLLTNVGGKFVTGHLQHLTTELAYNQLLVLGLSVLEDKLDDIVLKKSISQNNRKIV